MLLAELVDAPQLGLRLRYDAPGALDRAVGRAVKTDLLEPGRYLAGSELVFTELAWRRTPEDSETFVRSVAECGVTTLVTGTALFGPAPDDLVAACRRHRVTLIEVPSGTPIIDVTDHVAGVHAAESGNRLSAGLVRQRELLASLATGRSIEEITARVAREISHPCRVLTPTGRRIVGDPGELPDAAVTAVVRAYLTTDLLPALVRIDDREVSVLPAGSGLGHRLTGWLLVVDGDHRDWPREHLDAVGDLGAIVALERTRREEVMRSSRPIAADLLALVESAAPPAAVASRLHQAGLDPEAGVVAMVIEPDGVPGDQAAALAEDVAHAVGSPVVARDGDERLVGLLPAAPEVTDRLRILWQRVAPGLGRGVRLAVGVSGAADATAVAGALDEARHAARAARAGNGAVTVVGSDDVTSHALLLAAVPDDVRRAYALRVLGTVADHDARAGTELVLTLRAFLDCSGSWTRTAETLHLHVNTVRYRIDRVQELTGRDLSDLADRVDVYIALASL